MRLPTSLIALITLVGLPCLAAHKQASALTVTAVSYRAIPHERTSYFQSPGQSNTQCYGSSTDVGMWTNLNLNCNTVSRPPTVQPVTIRSIEVYNFVEANGMGYTIRCTAHWIGSSCSWLTPGDTFPAEVKGTTMWITARRGGNMGKEIHTKYALLDMRPTQARYPVAPVSLPNFHNLTPTSQAPATLSPSPAPSTGLIEITFTSNPPNALVTMYGQPVGRTPVTTKLAPGTYDATFAASGYASLVQQVTVAPGYPAMVTATLRAGGN